MMVVSTDEHQHELVTSKLNAIFDFDEILNYKTILIINIQRNLIGKFVKSYPKKSVLIRVLYKV